MNVFPVTNSTIDPKCLGSFIEDKYSLSTDTSCKLFRTGINHSYIVTDGEEKYVFRIYSFEWRTELEIYEEIRLLNLLKEHSISVSYPIPDENQHYIQKINAPEGVRYGVLFSYAKGEKIRNFSLETTFEIGSLMAYMHKKTESLKLKRTTYNAHTLTGLPYNYAKEHFSEANEDMRFIKQAGVSISNLFKKVDTRELREGVVHLDIWYDNMHINSASEITIFDFDFCGNGWLLHDIAYFMMQLYHVETDKTEFQAKQQAFMEGYESIIKISEEEKRLLPYSGLSIWIFYLGVQSQRFDNWSNIFLSENYLKRYVGMVKEWLDYNEIDLAHSH